MRVLLFVCTIMCWSLPPASAQELGDDQPLRDQWVQDWVARYKQWQVDREALFYYMEWRYWLVKSFPINERDSIRPKLAMITSMHVPVPPFFLGDICRTIQIPGTKYHEPCRLYRDSRDNLATRLARRAEAASIAYKENPRKSTFVEKIHLDGAWSTVQYPFPHIYGVVGVHVSIWESGRFQLSMPGAMVVLVPGPEGHEFKPAITYGFSYRIKDFTSNWGNRVGSLHINFAPVKILGWTRVSGGDSPFFDSQILLVGLSITPF